MNNYNGFKLTSLSKSTSRAAELLDLAWAGNDTNKTNSTNTTAGPIIFTQCNPATDIFKCAYSSVKVKGYTELSPDDATPATNPFQTPSMAAFINGLCEQLSPVPEGAPKTARAASVAIMAGGKTYTAAYFTAPKNLKCL